MMYMGVMSVFPESYEIYQAYNGDCRPIQPIGYRLHELGKIPFF